MNSAAYPPRVQSQLDYARREMRTSADDCRINSRASGQVNVLLWLGHIDKADYMAFNNEKFFLYDRACDRRRAAEKGASE